MNVQTAKNWVVLAVYSLILLSLLRPGGRGQDVVHSFGEALSGLTDAAA